MLLKKKYNLNHLIKQKRLVLLDSSALNRYSSRKASNLTKIKGQKDRLYSKSKNGGLKSNTIKTLNNLLNINKYPFFENYERFKYKQIHTSFRSIISDQKKRTFFAKDELKKVIFKTLLSTNQKTFLFTQRMLLNGLTMWALESLPVFFQKTKLRNTSQFSALKTHSKDLFKKNNMLKTNAFEINKNFSSGYARLGPILFLEDTINPLFTEKIKSFSRIRNRCLLSGRSSIVGKYRLSRICFRHYVNRGYIPGLIKNRK